MRTWWFNYGEIMTEKDKLVEELNRLSESFPESKERMIEIAKILLKDHYGYLPRKHKDGWKSSVQTAEKK